MPWFVPWIANPLKLLALCACASGCDPDEDILLRANVFLRNNRSAYSAHPRGPPRVLFGLDYLAIDRHRLILTTKYLEVDGQTVDSTRCLGPFIP